MNQYKFSVTSQQRLFTCHPDLQKIMNLALKRSPIDFGIAEGHRSTERQNKLYNEGKSKIDGITRLGKHNYEPSLAVDFYAFVNGAANWDAEHTTFIAGIIHGVAEELFEKKQITHKIRWGGNWDMDGVILIDQSFDDRPHIELIKPKK